MSAHKRMRGPVISADGLRTRLVKGRFPHDHLPRGRHCHHLFRSCWKPDMKRLFKKRNRAETQFVRLDTRRCEACWKCIEACTDKVIGKVDLPWHKHARINNADNCKGCLKCVNACESGALTEIHRQNSEALCQEKIVEF